MNATILENEIQVIPSENNSRLTISVPNDWEDVKKICKKVLSFNGNKYTFIGWNSDTHNCYFILNTSIATIGRK